MDRREAIRKTGFLFGSAAFSAITLSSLSSCQTGAAELPSWKPDYLSVEQGQIVRTIADILIPTTDTPGALEAGVPEYINMVARDILKPEEQKQFQAAFVDFAQKCESANGKSFVDSTPEEQLSFLQKIEKEAQGADGPTFIETMKGMVYRGFFTSEVGMTEVLEFDPVPGNYDGCIPFADIGNTWAM